VAVFGSQEMKGILAGAINRLGEREKIVITPYYYEGLTLAEIGQVLGSPSRGPARCTPRRSSSSRPRCRPPAEAARNRCPQLRGGGFPGRSQPVASGRPNGAMPPRPSRSSCVAGDP
jgi:hypothetical protein